MIVLQENLHLLSQTDKYFAIPEMRYFADDFEKLLETLSPGLDELLLIVAQELLFGEGGDKTARPPGDEGVPEVVKVGVPSMDFDGALYKHNWYRSYPIP